MVRREGRIRNSRAEKLALRVVNQRTIAAEDKFERFIDDQTISYRLASQQSCLVRLWSVVEEAPRIGPCGNRSQRHNASVRDIVCCLLVVRTDVEGLGHRMLIAVDQHASRYGQRDKPYCIERLHV